MDLGFGFLRPTPEDVDCKLCTEYPNRDRELNHCLSCPWLAERLNAGTVGYGEAVRDGIPHKDWLNARLESIIQHFNGSMFRDESHWQRWEEIMARTGFRLRRDVPARAAAVYLLTAEPDLFDRCEACFCWQKIAFRMAELKGIPPRDYALFHAAKDLYDKSSGVSLEDLACAEDVDEAAFALIINALLLARYGYAALEIDSRDSIWALAAKPGRPRKRTDAE